MSNTIPARTGSEYLFAGASVLVRRVPFVRGARVNGEVDGLRRVSVAR